LKATLNRRLLGVGRSVGLSHRCNSSCRFDAHMEETVSDFETVLAHSPAWKPYGIDGHGLLKPGADSFDPLEPAEVAHAMNYLIEGMRCGEVGRVTVIKENRSSYSWKHLAEQGLLHKPRRPTRYVSNGSFLAAAALLGIEMRPCEPGCLNAYLAIAWLPKPSHMLWRPANVMYGELMS